MWALWRLISLPHVRQHRGRVVLAAAGIALGVAVFVAVRVTNVSTLRAFARTVDAIAGRASLEITGYGAPIDERLLTVVRRTPGVAAAAPLVLADVLVQEAEGAPLLVAGIDLVTDRAVRDYTFAWQETDRRDPLALLTQPDALVLSTRFARRYGLRLGDPVHVHTAQGTRRLVVRGLLRPTGAAEALGGHFAVMDIAAAQLLFHRLGRLDRIDVVPQAGFPLDALQAALQQRLGPGVQVRRPQARNRTVEKMLRSFHVNLTALSLIALIVGLFLIYNSTTSAVVQRRRELGILRALGVARRRLRRLILGEALLLGAVGSVAGVGLGLLLARLALWLVAPAITALFLREHLDRLVLTPGTALAGVALGLGTTLGAAAWPVREALRVAPLDALQQRGVYTPRQAPVWPVTLVGLGLLAAAYGLSQLPPLGEVALFGYLACLALVLGLSCLVPLLLRALGVARPLLLRGGGVEGLLALDNLRYALRRTTVATAALLTSFAMMISVAIMIQSFKRTVYTWVEQTLRADLLVHQASPGGERSGLSLPHALRDELLRLDGVRDVDSARALDITYRGDPVLLVAVDFDVYARYGTYPFAAGDPQAAMRQVLEAQAVLVSENFSRRYRLGVGDTLVLPTPRGPQRFAIAGVVIDYSSERGTITMNRRTYVAFWDDPQVDAFGVFVAPGADLDEVAQRIQRHFAGRYPLYVLTRGKFKERVLELVAQPFWVTYALEIIAIAVALLGVTTALSAAILERTRELGVLRAVGATRQRLARMVLLEGGLMGVVGGSSGLVAGFFLALILIYVINRQVFGWTLQLTVPGWFAAAAFVLLVAATLAASWRPAQQAARVPVVEAIQYE
ncbi:MAG: permease [Candidatus Tectimicrobiota bacterium]|nr:MAG: permease [Candidatus Tectomicrobia bacterium]